MLANRVRMGSGGKNDIILYDKGNIYTEYGRTKDFIVSGAVGSITFHSDHFHIYIDSVNDMTSLYSMVGFKLPPNLPTNAKIRVKYFDCSSFGVSLAPSIDYLNSREQISFVDVKPISKHYSGTGEIIIPLGDTTGYEVVGVSTATFYATESNRFEKLEVII